MLYYAPISIIILIAWCFSGVYAIQRVGNCSYISERYIEWVNVLAMVAGPVVIAVVLGLEFFDKFKTSIKSALDVKSRKINAEVLILDSQGEELGISNNKNNVIENIVSVKKMIWEATKNRANDIFIDPKPDKYVIRLRANGGIKELFSLDKKSAIGVIGVVKVAAGMDISEHRRPQDGSFSAEVSGGKVAFRVASAGALGGEKLTIRVLGSGSAPKSLSDMGFPAKELELMQKAIRLPSGIVLICGPTGSGKTSTLYNLLGSIDYDTKNVMSIEDPIENIMPQVSQLEVNKQAGITFAGLLRNALRQNPDIICLGEIRDEETAEVAFHASQTGHLIVATLHSNDNLGAIDRLRNLGVPLRSISATLKMAVSQRLVRKLCTCKERAVLPEHYTEYFATADLATNNIFKPSGCRECEGTGYLGRTAIFDLMPLNSKLRLALEAEDASMATISASMGDSLGQGPMFFEGMKLVAAGVTSIDEVEQVTLNME